MTISIPSSFWNKYVEACDFFIDDDHIGRSCTLVYPPKRESCVNCITMVGSSTANVYRDGGPMPFRFGSCPMCGGSGYKEVETTDTIRLRIYWSRADWIRLVTNIVSDDAEVMVIGYISDLPKFRKADTYLLAKDNNEDKYRTTKAGDATPWGFGKNRYFVAYLKGA